MPQPGVRMSDGEFAALAQLVRARTGVVLDPARRGVLERRLAPVLARLGLWGFGELAEYLRLAPDRDEQFEAVLEAATVHHTKFFRNATQLGVFEGVVLPRLLGARSADRRLRIWSAGCATGEEAYTLAMIVHGAVGEGWGGWRIEIVGTDISARAVAHAERGVYEASRLQDVNPVLARRHFEPAPGGGVRVRDELRSCVRFGALDLRDDLNTRRMGVFDAIFCRNVLHYFDQEARGACIRLLESRLARAGVLFLGHAETPGRCGARLAPVVVPRSAAYERARTAPAPKRAAA